MTCWHGRRQHYPLRHNLALGQNILNSKHSVFIICLFYELFKYSLLFHTHILWVIVYFLGISIRLDFLWGIYKHRKVKLDFYIDSGKKLMDINNSKMEYILNSDFGICSNISNLNEMLNM